MANLKNGSVCLVCSSNADSDKLYSNFNSEVEVFSNFLRFVTRYLSYGHISFNNKKIAQFLTTVKSQRFSSMKCCSICIEQLKKFLEVYKGFELIQLELLNILDRISAMMIKSCSDNQPEQISDFQVAFTNLVEGKRTKQFPVVKIKRLETGNIKNESRNLSENETGLPLSVYLLKREPSPFEDDHDHIDYEDFYPDSNFEASSQKDLPESLENENESKPIILKTVNIKIDNDTNHHNHEEEITSSKDSSPNHQQSTRKLFPKLMKCRVKDSFKCIFCSENHPNRSALFRHIMRQHTDERPHHCKQCSQEFRDRHGLRKHLIRGHFTDDDIRGNRPEPVKDKPCPICGKLFSTNSNVGSHISYIHTKVKNFKCEHKNCSKAFVKRSDLIKHQVVHTDLKPFKCNICQKMLKRRCQVAKHKLLIHGVETGKKGLRAECSVCGKIFPGMRRLRLHRAHHHPDIFKDDRESLMKFKCPRDPCDKKFVSRYDVRKHVRNKHDRINLVNFKNHSLNLSENEIGLPLSVNHLKREPLPFEDDHVDFEDLNLDSNFETSSPKDLLKSLENEYEAKPVILQTVSIKIDNENRHDHSEELPSSKDSSSDHRKLASRLPSKVTNRRVQYKSKFTCPFCCENQQSQVGLFRHMGRHTNERPHHCKECLMEYRYHSDLRDHLIKGHHIDDETGEKRPACVKDNPCPICGKLFSTNRGVQSHISYIHSRVKNFKCEHENCSKAFVKRSDLIKHQVAHTDLKPFQCNICQQMFKRRCEVAKHKFSIHGVETGKTGMRAECSVCGKVFPEMRRLRIHRARHHPDIFKDDRESLMKFKCPRAPCGQKFLSRYDVRKHVRSKHYDYRINLVNI